MGKLIEIRDLSKVYVRGKQKVEVLHHIDLDVNEGDFLALMGPSGSGKTTLLNLIGGLDVPSGGSITVGGQRIDQLSAGALAKWRAAIALQLVGLADRAAHKPGELSGGQQQRVAIARAIVSDPTLLICDEPTGDLDRASAEEILGLLQMLNRDHNKTIVMVTHDPKAAEYATHTLHLDKGNLVEQAVHA